MSPVLRTAVIFMIIACSSSASYALPTPDALINVFQLFPLLAGGLTALVTFFALHFRRRLAKAKDPIRVLSTVTLCLGLGLIVCIGIIIINSARASQGERVADVAMYFRSDLALDALELRARDSQSKWFDSGAVTELLLEDADAVLGSHANPILIDLGRLQMLHESGSLVFKNGSERMPFEFVRASELETTLNTLSLDSPENAQRPIVFYNWNRYSLWHNFDDADELVSLLQKFENVYALPRMPLAKIRSASDAFDICVRDPASGELKSTREERGHIDYPVRQDGIAFNERAVVYPNLMKLLSAAELLELLEDDEVAIIAPYSSLYRDESVQRYFVGRFLSPLGEERIHYLDFNGDQAQSEIERVAKELDGRRFVTVGLSKQEWVYMGIDLAYLAWNQTDRDPKRFGYLGSSVQLPEAAALLVLQKSSLSSRGSRKLGMVFGKVIEKLARTFDLSLGLALLVFAVALRILLAPIGYLEARSRNLHADLQGLSTSLHRERPDAYFLIRNENAIAALLGCRRWIEVVGGMLSLVLILPFYSLLRDLSVPDLDPGFFGVPDVSGRSTGLALILIAIIAMKIMLGRIGPHGARFKSTDLLTAGVLAGFVFLLARIPAAVVVYAIGVIGMQTVLDLLARIRTWPTVSRALQLKPATAAAPGGDATLSSMALIDSPSMSTVGNKARRLGDLLRDRSPLFCVPGGVVLTAAGISRAETDSQSFIAEVAPEVTRVIPGDDLLAVRSCGLSEDGAHSSLAGRYETLLNVKRDELVSAVCEVAASFDPGESATRSVIVQRMAKIDMAGVLFSAAPDNAQTTAVEYNAGLGDKLVSGETTPITMRVGRFSGCIAEGDEAPEGGDGLTDRRRRSLGLKLALVGRMLEQKFGRPQDIEWGYSIAADLLYVIQTRDVTATLAPEAVADEQQKLLAQATAGARSLATGTTVWARSDIDEVVENPSPFTRSLLLRLYSNRGSLGIALRNLGIPAAVDAPGAIASVFGRLLENRLAMSRVRGGAVRRLLAIQRLKRQLRSAGRQSMVVALDKRLDELHALTMKLPAALPQMPEEELLKLIVERLKMFGERYYAIGYETTLLAELAERYLPESELISSPASTTRTAQMFGDLQGVRDDSTLATFLERWGHRGQNEYELAAPSFAESPELVHEIASRFSSPSTGARATQDESLQVGFYDSLVRVKEVAKDESIRYLRGIKPLLVALAEAWSIAPETIFDLQVDEIVELAGNSDRARRETMFTLAARRRSELNQLRQQPLADSLSIENVEFLDARSYSELGDDAARPESNAAPGRMISARNAFAGPVHRIESDSDYSRPLKPGCVLVTRHLSPQLVPLFDEASGCISQNGGMLSHAAIVAREMGIPIVVGVQIDSPLFGEARLVEVNEDGGIRSPD